MKKIAVIDGNSLMHRGYHAVPDYMTADDGTHTNAIFGFLQMLLKMNEKLRPDAIICAFDAGIPEFRKTAIERYKAQRPPTDPALKEQFPLIENILRALNIPVVKVPGWEGDDILGTISRLGEEQGMEVLLVSGDRDIFQLASELTKVVHTKTGMSDVVVYGPDEVRERYGIGPELVPDFISLKGDSSDNIPGVAGIGEKTAAKLLQEYGSVHEIVAHADELKGKQRESIKSSVEEIDAGLLVATIVRDVEGIDVDLDAISFPSYTPADIREAFMSIKMTQHYSKFLALVEDDGSGDGSGACPTGKVEPGEVITGDAALAAVEEFIADGREVSVLIEQLGQATLFGAARAMAICDGPKVAIVDSEEEIPELLAKLVRSNSVIAMDAKHLLQTVIPADSSKPALVEIAKLEVSRLFDISIAAYLLASDVSKYTLETLAPRYLECEVEPDSAYADADEEGSFAILAARATAAFRLASVLRTKLEEDSSLACFTNIDMALVPALLSIERVGMELDCPRLAEIGVDTAGKIAELEQQIYALAGSEFNIGSPKQLGKVLFEDLGLPAGKKTRSGYSTDASVLTDLKDKYEIAGLVLEYRELSKIKGTYIDALPQLLRGDSRLHTTLNQTITATGRLSSSDPNLQNIPVRTDLGRLIRTAFPPYSEMGEPGVDAVFLSADYSQIELRLLAALSGDEGLIAAFNEEADFHRATAAQVFGVPFDDVTPQMRSRAKAVNFGIVYGQQAFGLARSLGIGLREAQGMIDRYFEAYPKVKLYLDGLVAKATADGYVSTMFGRKRHVHELASSNRNIRSAGERIAMNHPMQGSAADIIKLAMIGVHRRLIEEGFASVMMLQVHDELDFSCPIGEIERLSAMVVETMEGVIELPVKLEVSVSYGPTWADAK